MGAIQRIVLENFRNYKTFTLNVTQPIVVLWGPNGAGKTNILEALSLLGGGRGLRTSTRQDMLRHGQARWAIHVDCETTHALGLGFDNSHGEGTKQFRLDGVDIKSATPFTEHLRFLWLTPEHDRLFIASPSSRRRFFDRLAYALNGQHGTFLNRYERLIKERQEILRNGSAPSWLDAVENNIALCAQPITQTRQQLCDILNEHKESLDSHFPRFVIELEGKHAWDGHPSLEDYYRDAFARSRTRDRESGTTHIGPHRTDWNTLHVGKQTAAHLCSTGEQKILLLSLILSFLHGQKKQGETPIILLLDDIISHLDLRHRMLLFKELERFENADSFLDRKIQTWITGTDKEAFAFLEGKADFCEIQHP